MKKLYIPMMLMAVAAIASCEKQPVAINEPATGTYIYTMKASVPEGVDVKSDYDASGNFSWSSGDAISVLFHNGDDNKFFTLTTTGTGANASFSGAIDDGYTIGASDGDDVDKKIWVLFPASANHRYVAGDSKPARFYMPQVTDYTAPGAHYSANIPMYDLLAAEGDISFKNLGVGYKFTVTNLDASVTKIKFTVENQVLASSGWYALSGEIKIHAGDVYLDHAGAGSVSQATISYITNVDAGSHSAVIYVPFRYYAAGFKPIVTIQDYNSGNILKTLTATNEIGITTMGQIKPITISAPGTGSFVSPLGVDWTSGTVTTAGDGVHYTGIKAKADADYLYVQLGVYKSMLTINSDYLYANSVNYYFGAANGYFGYLYKNGIPELADAGSSVPQHAVLEVADVVYYEWKCVRATKFGGALEGAGAINIKFLVYYNNYKPDAGSSTVTDWGSYVYSPEVTVTLP